MAHASGVSNLPEKPKYVVNIPLAIGAGILAQVVWLILYYPVYLYYWEDSLDLARLFGSFVVAEPTWIAQILGLGVLFGIGAGTAVAYAWLLSILNLQSSGATGLIFGFVYYVPIVAFVIPWTVGLLAQWTNMVRDGMPVRMNLPDTLLNQAGHGNANWDGPALVLVAYLIYGLIVGAMYRHKLRDTSRYRIQYAGG